MVEGLFCCAIGVVAMEAVSGCTVVVFVEVGLEESASSEDLCSPEGVGVCVCICSG